MSKPRFTKGQMVMGLAAQLHGGGLDAAVAMNAAIDIMADLKVPPRWRERLGDKIANAIDGDIADPKTWLAGQPGTHQGRG
jgi:hypothetical protein